MKHSKTGTNLSKPKKRSEIIAQQTKTVEKLNISQSTPKNCY